MFVAVVVIYWSGYTTIYFYQVVLAACVEFLNLNIKYTSQGGHYWNLFYLIYLFFITSERGKWLPFEGPWKEYINIAEHLLFAIVVYSLLYFIELKFSLFKNNIYKLVCIFFAFNIIGVLNEIFQNVMSKRVWWVMVLDSQKDIMVNMFGSFACCLIFASIYKSKKTV